jgi:hypothetical protein
VGEARGETNQNPGPERIRGAPTADQRPACPNFTSVVTDDQRYDMLGCTGHPDAREVVEARKKDLQRLLAETMEEAAPGDAVWVESSRPTRLSPGSRWWVSKTRPTLHPGNSRPGA